MMTNAKQEFIEETKDKTIKCAQLAFEITYGEYEAHDLHEGWTHKDWGEFLLGINKSYDSGFGGQELYGVIWYTDGTWSERGEYDGSEWWAYKKAPEWGDRGTE